MELQAISPSELRALLNEGVTNFAFRKVGGNLRLAMGTTNLDSIPAQHHPNGVGHSGSNVKYFDLEKQAWRSVSSAVSIYKQ